MPTINKKQRHNTYRKSDRSEVVSKVYNSRWSRLRDSYLMDHPLCEICLLKGKTVPAKEVHHIKPISTGKDQLEMEELAYNYKNLMALCIECHHEIHKQMRRKH